LLLAGILLLGLALRVPGLFRDLPFTYYGDEAHLIKRAMMIASGDLNPHWFNKPALLMYVLAFAYGVMYLAGAAIGKFESPEQFAGWYLDDPGAFILVGRCIVCAFGVLLVYLVFRVARRLFENDRSALAAGALAAVLGPLMFASQQIKADVPCATLIMLSFFFYLKSRESGRWRDFLLAGLVGGFAVGTKYYGIILIPAFAVGELFGRSEAKRTWPQAFQRTALLPVIFAIGFFLVSPYHFLDPTWSSKVVHKLSGWVDPDARQVIYDPDSRVEFETGPSSLGGATVHFVQKFVSPAVVGLLPTLLMLLGIAGVLATSQLRRRSLVPLVAIATFVLMAVTLGAYHTNFRHLAAILPLLCLFALPPTRMLQRRGVRVGLVGLLLLAVSWESYRDVQRNQMVLREDSRNRAQAWIVANVGPGDRVLLDDYGPQLGPNRASLERMRRRLGELPKDEAFTANQEKLIRIREQHASPAARNVDRLGHLWWLNEEQTEEDLLADERNRSMSNPLVQRAPKTLEQYERLGYDYIVTNSSARAPYFDGSPRAQNFPTWKKFYAALDQREPVQVFDPREWGGKGPVVRVYRLRSGDPANGGADAPH